MSKRRVILLIVALPFFYMVAAWVAVGLRMQRLSEVNEELNQAGDLGESIAKEMRADKLSQIEPVVEQCKKRIEAGSPQSILFYFAGAHPSVKADLPEGRKIRGGQIRSLSSSGEIVFGRAGTGQSMGRPFDDWLTFMSELPTRWGYWVDVPRRNHPDAKAAEYLVVTLVRSSMAPKVDEEKSTFEGGGAVIQARVVKIDDRATACEGVLFARIDKVRISGRGRTDEEAQERAKEYANNQAQDTFLRSLTSAGPKQLCFLGGDELCRKMSY